MRDDDDEPITDLNQIKRVLKTFMKQQAEDAKAAGQRQQHVKQTNVLLTTMDAYEKDFAADTPDYYKAADYVRDQRRAELEDLGFTGRKLEEKLADELFGMTRDRDESRPARTRPSGSMRPGEAPRLQIRRGGGQRQVEEAGGRGGGVERRTAHGARQGGR